jgi:quinol monooxygenase YgiN
VGNQLDHGKHARVTARTADPCAVVELRQYTHHPGRRDDLIELFEEKFLTGQAEAGMTVIATFRDANDPDRFVWLRGFESMQARAEALQTFYGGPLWKANRDAANATIVDNDNVLLLRDARPGSGFGPDESRGGLIAAMIYPAGDDGSPAFAEFFERTIRPALVNAGSSVLATFVTEHSDNTFPGLPVREGEDVFVWFARFVDRASFERYLAAGSAQPQPSDVLLLAPTARSRVQ